MMRFTLSMCVISCVLSLPLNGQAPAPRLPNELGRIPILEYHQIGDSNARWSRSRDSFRKDLALLYARGYRPVTVADLVSRKLNLPAGLSPVVITFDDASPGQFSYRERAGRLEIDPNSAVGIWMALTAQHPDWKPRATFCLLPSAKAGHAFFGDKGIAGQRTEWRFRKLQFLVQQGFELCNHTLWHAKLNTYSDALVQEQIGRALMAIDSAVAAYPVRTFALPLGLWPRNAALARRGSWRDAKSGKTVTYQHDAVLEVSGNGGARSPYDPRFDAGHLPRWQVIGNRLDELLNQLDKNGERYVSDGNPTVVARPAARPAPTR
jgi:peptidoglycan/xylan/chitin deacetylase (PgdA/CDA1 family)